MAKNKISEYSATPADNTDISNINIAEGCSPANVNNAIRSLMSQIKDLQAGTSGDTIPLTAGGTGSTTATDARTALSAAKSGANSDITSITGLTTPLTVAQGGTGTSSTTFANLTTNVTGTLPIANGGTGLTTLTANNVILGNGTSTPSFVAPSTTGNVLTSNGTTWTSSALNRLTSATVQASTSGTAINFTGIPSWVKKINIMFNGVSTNGTAIYLIQIGSGSTLTTGYAGSAQNQASQTVSSASYVGFPLQPSVLASNIYYGVLTLFNLTGNTWVLNGQVLSSSNANSNWATGANASLGGALDRVIITTNGATDTFDAGSINIMYE